MLQALNYGNYGRFLMMGNAGFISLSVVVNPNPGALNPALEQGFLTPNPGTLITYSFVGSTTYLFLEVMAAKLS